MSEKEKIDFIDLDIEGVEKENYLKVKSSLIEQVEQATASLEKVKEDWERQILPTTRILKCAKEHIDPTDTLALKHIEKQEKQFEDEKVEEMYLAMIEQLQRQIERLEYVLKTYFTETVINNKVAVVNPLAKAYVEIQTHLVG